MSSPQPTVWQRRLAALLEVVGIFVTGTLLARLANRWLNPGPVNLRALAPGEPPDFLALSWSTAENLIIRYGFIFGLAFAVGWWHRRRRLREYGVTTAGRPLRKYVMIAVLLFAAFELPSLLVKFLAGEAPLGDSPQHWALIQNLNRPEVWLYLLVGSFGLVPIMEELFFRGYVQTRLAEDFGASAAILTTSLFFAFSHTQYFIAGPIGAGMVVSLFVTSVGIGYARHRTGSLLPGTIAHATGNLPFRGWAEPTVLALMVVFVVVRRRAIAEYASRLWRDVMVRESITGVGQAVVVLVVLLVEVLLVPKLLPASAGLALGAALLLETREKRSNGR